jgi:hypothetical protein
MSRGYPVRGGPTRCRVSQSILTSATDSVMKSLQRQAIHVTLVATRTAVLAVVQRAPRMPALGSKPHGGVGELSDAVVVCPRSRTRCSRARGRFCAVVTTYCGGTTVPLLALGLLGLVGALAAEMHLAALAGKHRRFFA